MPADPNYPDNPSQQTRWAEDRIAVTPRPGTEVGRAPSLWERAQERSTPLLAKLGDLTDEEWQELTHRMTKHFNRELESRGMVIVSKDYEHEVIERAVFAMNELWRVGYPPSWEVVEAALRSLEEAR